MTSDGAGSALPFARGQSFATLDEYLAHRRRLGTMDVPYYREVSPGRYRLEGGSPTPVPAPDRIWTREELLEKYGFER
ncbi:MAG: hypothetical protein K5872_18075 [Rhizobiaceae bacterium]|nr:hypothetical protein [Rhizobiaceae bacterium]MCV0408134.1 hypothetical protein [Rhizobiaceae bacterium]